jgi:hypothetical protein
LSASGYFLAAARCMLGERRRQEARFFLIERRDRGNLWKFGNIALCVMLGVFIVWLYGSYLR